MDKNNELNTSNPILQEAYQAIISRGSCDFDKPFCSCSLREPPEGTCSQPLSLRLMIKGRNFYCKNCNLLIETIESGPCYLDDDEPDDKCVPAPLLELMNKKI